jgi:hypothetical protein
VNLVDDDDEEDLKSAQTKGEPELPEYEEDNPPPVESSRPSPEQRADFVVKRLEQFIREGRTVGEGMSLRQWMDMARFEISNALHAAEQAHDDEDVVSRRLLFTVAASLVTVGFWGTLFAYDKVQYLVVAIVFGITGIFLLAIVGEWQLMKYFRRHQARQRERSLHRVEDLTRRIKRMEKELKDEHRALQSKLKRQYDRARQDLLKNIEGKAS